MGESDKINPEQELASLKGHSKHFLDANLLIGFSVKWDDMHSPSAYYFDISTAEYVTSIRVHEEARKVVETCRRRTLQVAAHVADDFSIGEEYRLLDDLQRFVDREFDDLKSPVKKYISHRESIFQQLAHSPPDNLKNELQQQIKQDFQVAVAFLQKLKTPESSLHIWTDAPEDHSPTYPGKFSDLNQIMENSDDRDLLLDAYHYFEKQQEDTLLIATLDRSDFVEDRSTLEDTLRSIKILDLLGLYRMTAGQTATHDH